jgi:transketolase
MAKNKDLDELSINTLRFLSVDGVQKANSGHPGMPMGDASMAYVLWKNFLRHNPKNPRWAARDRFVLSAGHGSMLLYSLLHLTGYDITMEDIKNFRQWDSPTPGHPEYDLDRGIETTTGPLGQGFATGVGMAMAERYLADRYNKDGFKLFDYNIFAITSDGDLMEGISNEAASLAGHLGLGKIVYLYSDNHITIEGTTDISFTEDVEARFKALGWHTIKVDGNDTDAVSSAIEAGKAEAAKPTLILARTHIGFGSPKKQDSPASHGSPLGDEEITAAKERLGWPYSDSFHVPEEVAENFKEGQAKGKVDEEEWNKLFDKYSAEHSELASELKALLKGDIGSEWSELLPSFDSKDGRVPTRSASGKVLNAIAPKAPFLIGGSADLAPSNNTFLKDLGVFDKDGSAGQNIHYGVREHAMGAIMNGIAHTGLIPFGGTFLVFSDYMRGAIRLAALSGLHVVYVFTHDSIGLGEDGPTHQPIEHLASLRAMPGLTVIRPGDANETVEAWRVALEKKGPTVLALTRQKLSVIDRNIYKGKASGVARGGYVLADVEEGKGLDVILIASGSELELALSAYEALKAKGIAARVVSMPSTDIFDEQDAAYREEVLPRSVRARLAIEAASTVGWHKYVGLDGEVLGIERFGASAPYERIYKEFGFTAENITAHAEALIKDK